MSARIEMFIRALVVVITGGSIATSSALAAYQVPPAPAYMSPLIGVAGTAMLALVGLTYRGVIKKIDDYGKASRANYIALQEGQDATIQAIFTLSSRLHPEASDVILEELQALTKVRSEVLAEEKRSAAASGA